MYEISEKTRSNYTYLRWVDDRGWCGVHQLMFHWTVHHGITDDFYEGRYCFQTEAQAISSLEAWDGKGDMPGDWHKHPETGRRRDPLTGATWDENEIRPTYSEVFQKIELVETCEACPEQYDAVLDGEIVGYLRLRHGYFSVECPDVGGELVYSGRPLGDGLFESSERPSWLANAKAAIAQWVVNRRRPPTSG